MGKTHASHSTNLVFKLVPRYLGYHGDGYHGDTPVSPTSFIKVLCPYFQPISNAHEYRRYKHVCPLASAPLASARVSPDSSCVCPLIPRDFTNAPWYQSGLLFCVYWKGLQPLKL